MDDDLTPSEIPSLTDDQEIVLSLLFVFSGTLSVLGSSTIVYKVLKNREKATPYDRLMLGLSGCDIVASLTLILGPFLLPQETSPRVWARGTDATCTMLGFFAQLAFASIFYNCMLSFYCLLTVRFGVKRKRFAERYETWMHLFTIFYFLLTAVGGAAIGLYSEVDVGFGCWVNDYPSGCVETDTCISQHIGWAFGGLPTVFTFLSLLINNLVIYYHVRRRLGSDTNEGLAAEQALTAKQALTVKQYERISIQKAQIEEVATQGFLYVATFICAYTPAIVLRFVEAYRDSPVDETPIYPLLVLNSIFLPLQGFFNMFVYNRPNYARVRAAHPGMSAFWAVRKACLDPDIPRLTEIFRPLTPNEIARLLTPSKKSRPGITKHGSKAGSGLGRSFNSNLDIVCEGSGEDDSDVVEEEDEDEGEAKNALAIVTNTTLSVQELDISMADFSDDDSDELYLKQEYMEVFREAAVSLRRIKMDGLIGDSSSTSINSK
jgi:hypothetical protein